MTNERDPAGDAALRSLPREAPVPPALEDRVVAALRERRLIATPRRTSIPWLAAAAACFLAGWLTHDRAAPRRAPDRGPLYLLLLSPLPASPDLPQEAELVQEYREWAGALQRDDRLVRAEKLSANADLVPPPGPAAAARPLRGQPPSGFFLVRARSMSEATALARDCPHVRHGGTITVQAIDPT